MRRSAVRIRSLAPRTPQVGSEKLSACFLFGHSPCANRVPTENKSIIKNVRSELRDCLLDSLCHALATHLVATPPSSGSASFYTPEINIRSLPCFCRLLQLQSNLRPFCRFRVTHESTCRGLLRRLCALILLVRSSRQILRL